MVSYKEIRDQVEEKKIVELSKKKQAYAPDKGMNLLEITRPYSEPKPDGYWSNHYNCYVDQFLYPCHWFAHKLHQYRFSFQGKVKMPTTCFLAFCKVLEKARIKSDIPIKIAILPKGTRQYNIQILKGEDFKKLCDLMQEEKIAEAEKVFWRIKNGK